MGSKRSYYLQRFDSLKREILEEADPSLKHVLVAGFADQLRTAIDELGGDARCMARAKTHLDDAIGCVIEGLTTG